MKPRRIYMTVEFETTVPLRTIERKASGLRIWDDKINNVVLVNLDERPRCGVVAARPKKGGESMKGGKGKGKGKGGRGC